MSRCGDLLLWTHSGVLKRNAARFITLARRHHMLLYRFTVAFLRFLGHEQYERFLDCYLSEVIELCLFVDVETPETDSVDVKHVSV